MQMQNKHPEQYDEFYTSNARQRGVCMQMQNKYLEQYDDLYGEDLHIVKVPLLRQEVRGVESLSALSEMLLTPYKQEGGPAKDPFARIAELEKEVAELKKQLGKA
jgi:anion-transporting  ArsA/GET3 family ATPase